MGTFKVGDRVKDLGGRMGVIISYQNDRCFTIKMPSGQKWDCSANDWKKIGGTMTKYEELKSRIQALNNGWDKEADDVLQEIGDGSIYLCIRTRTNGIANHYGMEIQDGGKERIKGFPFDETQCSKMSAFKNALLYLLDHSDLKKEYDKAQSIVGKEHKVEIDGRIYKAKILSEL